MVTSLLTIIPLYVGTECDTCGQLEAMDFDGATWIYLQTVKTAVAQMARCTWILLKSVNLLYLNQCKQR